MDAQLKKDWVEALRSGEYRQGRKALHDKPSDSYCCLGVLCKVAGKELYPKGGANPDSGYLWLGTILPNGIEIFVNMNDKQGKTFNEIADYIEANL